MENKPKDTAPKQACPSCGGWLELCGDGCAITSSPTTKEGASIEAPISQPEAGKKGRIRRVTHPKGSGLMIIGARKP